MDLGDIPRDQHSLEVGRPTLRRLTMHDAMNLANPSHAVWFRIRCGLEREAVGKIVSMNQGARDLPVGLRAGRRCASSLIARETPSPPTSTIRFTFERQPSDPSSATPCNGDGTQVSSAAAAGRGAIRNSSVPGHCPRCRRGVRDACSSAEIDQLAQRHAGMRLPKDALKR